MMSIFRIRKKKSNKKEVTNEIMKIQDWLVCGMNYTA
jgi:hypothetical protein